MTPFLNEKVDALLEAALYSENKTDFIDNIKEDTIQITESLQFLLNSNKMDSLEVAMLTLLKVCPTETEEHLLNCLAGYLTLVDEAVENYDGNVMIAIQALIGGSSDEVSHLENCLNIESEV